MSLLPESSTDSEDSLPPLIIEREVPGNADSKEYYEDFYHRMSKIYMHRFKLGFIHTTFSEIVTLMNENYLENFVTDKDSDNEDETVINDANKENESEDQPVINGATKENDNEEQAETNAASKENETEDQPPPKKFKKCNE